MDAVVALLGGLHPIVLLILGILGLLVVVAQGVVLLTPSPKDDEKLAKFLAIPVLGPFLIALSKLAPFQKK